MTRRGDLHLIPDLTAPQAEWQPAPRFFLGRTAQGNVWHFRHDLDEGLKADLAALCRSEPPLQVGQEPTIAAQVRALLGAGEEYRGPAYLLPQQTLMGQATQIYPDQADLLLSHFPGTAERTRQGDTGPITAVIENGRAVAVCSSVRQSAEAAEPGVFTLEESRGKGYAVMVTALWANLVHENGLLAFYSTSWDNTASQSVAKKLNAEFFGEDWSIR